MTNPDNQPAFPCEGNPVQCGMSIRDWFAGQALAGLLSHPGVQYRVGPDEPVANSAFSLAAYAVSDAMCAERKKGQTDAG